MKMISNVNYVTLGECEEPKKKPEVNNMRKAMVKGGGYPAELRKEGVEGTVTMTFIVDENGGVLKQQLKSSSNYKLNGLAMMTGSYFTFDPGICGGKPAVILVDVPLKYKLAR
jgi:TonB family protein